VKKLLYLAIFGVLLAGMLLPSCSSDSGKIRVATDATWPPFEYVDDDGNIVGVDLDIMNGIAEEEGLDIEFVNVAWDALLAGMAQGTYDAAISSITITEDRAKDMLFSDPYFAAGQIVTVRADDTTITSKDDLTGTVGAQIGTTGAMEVEKISTATLKTYDTIDLAFQDLMNGQITAVICDNPVALLTVQANPGEMKTVGEVFTDESYGIAIAKGLTDLQEKINDGIEKIKENGTLDQISENWLGE